MKTWFDFASNVYSQNGEDGIVLEVTKQLGIDPGGWVCEFGAHTGKYLSNTFNLVDKFNFNAVYIECDDEKYKSLLQTAAEYPNILPLHEQVGDNLTRILKATPIPRDFDVLSIDIDGYDYDVWKHFDYYRPKIVIIEIDSSILPGISHTPRPDSLMASFTSMLELGQAKKYTFICHTGNMFFVADEWVHLLKIPPPSEPASVFLMNWLPFCHTTR